MVTVIDTTKKQVSDLEAAGFSFTLPEITPRLIVNIEGVEKSGKSHFALTAPGPIVYQSVDCGLEGVVQKFSGTKPIAVREYAFRVPTGIDRDNKPAVVAKVKEEWEKFTADYRAALKAKARTIVWDSASEIWEFLRLARLGKLEKVMPMNYAEVNAEFREMIRLAFDNDSNLILLHRLKDEWSEGGSKTGKKERKGMGEVGFLVQASARLLITPPKLGKDGSVTTPLSRSLQILECRMNPEATGTTLPDCDFGMLASILMPEVDPDVWG